MRVTEQHGCLPKPLNMEEVRTPSSRKKTTVDTVEKIGSTREQVKALLLKVAGRFS
jgi:hypothetical protein